MLLIIIALVRRGRTPVPDGSAAGKKHDEPAGSGASRCRLSSGRWIVLYLAKPARRGLRARRKRAKSGMCVMGVQTNAKRNAKRYDLRKAAGWSGICRSCSWTAYPASPPCVRRIPGPVRRRICGRHARASRAPQSRPERKPCPAARHGPEQSSASFTVSRRDQGLRLSLCPLSL